MIDPQLLRTDSQRLLAAASAGRLGLPAELPAGRLLGSEDGEDDSPVMWMSDGPAPAELWPTLHRDRERSGLWPLLLAPLGDEADFRPWQSQELYPRQMSSPDGHDAAALLRDWWEGVASCEADDPEEAAERLEVTAPFGPAWPGLAPAPAGAGVDPDEKARSVAAELLRVRPGMRIGLVPAGSGAQALAACGWSGPLNHESDTGKIAGVLRSWEHRFGAQVVGAGFDTLYLSVAAPPTDRKQALLIAAEHLALCPDNILQGHTDTLATYADDLIDEDIWAFWWD